MVMRIPGGCSHGLMGSSAGSIPRDIEHVLCYIAIRELSPLPTSLTSPQEEKWRTWEHLTIMGPLVTCPLVLQVHAAVLRAVRRQLGGGLDHFGFPL